MKHQGEDGQQRRLPGAVATGDQEPRRGRDVQGRQPQPARDLDVPYRDRRLPLAGLAGQIALEPQRRGWFPHLIAFQFVQAQLGVADPA